MYSRRAPLTIDQRKRAESQARVGPPPMPKVSNPGTTTSSNMRAKIAFFLDGGRTP